MAENEQEDEASKTEDPSSKKLEEARKRGQVAQSRDLSTWVMLLAATLLIGIATPSMFSYMTHELRGFFEHAHDIPGDAGGISKALTETLIISLKGSFLFLLIMMVAAIAGPAMQVGLMIAPEVLKPDFSKVSIMKGFGRLFSMKSIVEFIK